MDKSFNNKYYAICDTSELNLINFNEIVEESIYTVRKSLNLIKVVIKWNGTTPSFINELTTLHGIFNHQQILNIVKSQEWEVDVL